MKPIDADELAWGRECFAAGDSMAELAEWSGHSIRAWITALKLDPTGTYPAGMHCPPTGKRGQVLKALRLGRRLEDIADEVGCTRQAVGALRSRYVSVGLLSPDVRPEVVRSPTRRMSAKEVARLPVSRAVVASVAAGLSHTEAGKPYGLTRAQVASLVYCARNRSRPWPPAGDPTRGTVAMENHP